MKTWTHDLLTFSSSLTLHSLSLSLSLSLSYTTQDTHTEQAERERAMAISVAIGLKTVFCVLGCVMVATLIYTLSLDGLPFRKDLLTPWMVATLIDFYINVIAIGGSGLLCTCLLIVSGLGFLQGIELDQCITLGSSASMFWKESSEDPIYYVLMRRPNKCCINILLDVFMEVGNISSMLETMLFAAFGNLSSILRDGMEHKRRFSVVTTRIIFTALGFLMLGTLLYTLLTDGSPFRTELLTPNLAGDPRSTALIGVHRWMTATLIDFYINVVALSCLGSIQRVKLDKRIHLDSFIDMFWQQQMILSRDEPASDETDIGCINSIFFPAPS
ncbi:unnamed protein product [Camellia sinensis]